MKTHSILYFCFPIKGPNNGVKVISNALLHYWISSKKFAIEIIDTSQAKEFDSFGRIDLKKIWDAFIIFKKLLTVKGNSLIYMNFTPNGFAFIRDLIIVIICRLKNCKITAHVHSNGLEQRTNPITRFVLQKIKFILINQNQYNKISAIYNYTFLVRNSLPDFFKEKSLNFNSQNSKLNLLFMSNISEKKGLFELLDIINHISINDLDVELNICGGILESQHENLFLESIKKNPFVNYHGAVSEENEKYEHYCNNDFLLMLSKPNYEVSPLIYIEALMSGTPIITTKQVVSEKLINNGCAFSLNKDLNHLFEELLLYRKDRNAFEKLKIKCREYYLKFYSFEYFASSIESIIKK